PPHPRRTATESQVHRELASGMSVPIGFKNGTDGSLQIAIDAIGSAAASHAFLSVTKQGISASKLSPSLQSLISIVETDGNPSCHVILRGSNSGPNFSAEHVAATAAQLAKAKLATKIMIDCSHGNSEKKHERQVLVAESVAAQLSSPATASNIMGVMIESHLVAGKQSIPAEGPVGLTYGQSVTDACIDWATTVTTLDTLRKGVQERRKLVGERNGINRGLFGGQREREVSAEGARDFNDVNMSLLQTSLNVNDIVHCARHPSQTVLYLPLSRAKVKFSSRDCVQIPLFPSRVQLEVKLVPNFEIFNEVSTGSGRDASGKPRA
ncbi:3-deoxy-7-phosphoheptulonate synthase, partial [Phenoliferia sp. Uapishka_3]